jgi:uncharacterized membrane protein
MADPESKRESGAALMFIGLALWVADLLVLFFFRAANTPRQQAGFQMLIAILFLLGVWLMLRGNRLRRESSRELTEK